MRDLSIVATMEEVGWDMKITNRQYDLARLDYLDWEIFHVLCDLDRLDIGHDSLIFLVKKISSLTRSEGKMGQVASLSEEALGRISELLQEGWIGGVRSDLLKLYPKLRTINVVANWPGVQFFKDVRVSHLPGLLPSGRPLHLEDGDQDARDLPIAVYYVIDAMADWLHIKPGESLVLVSISQGSNQKSTGRLITVSIETNVLDSDRGARSGTALGLLCELILLPMDSRPSVFTGEVELFDSEKDMGDLSSFWLRRWMRLRNE